MALRLNGSSSGYVELDVPAAAGSHTLTLPDGGGSSGQYLSTDGSGGLSWQTVTSEILQVVHSRNATPGGVNSTTAWQDSGLTATITPVAAGSSILVLISQSLWSLNGGISSTAKHIKLRRGTTDLDAWVTALYVNFGGGAHAIENNEARNYLDTPTYTLGDAVSYNTQVRADNATSSSLTWNTYPSTMTLMEIAA
jgi:hypothetical protein